MFKRNMDRLNSLGYTNKNINMVMKRYMKNFSTKSIKNNITGLKLKQFAIPTVLMTGYFLFQSKKLFSSKNALLQGENTEKLDKSIRKLFLEGCESLQEGEMKQVKYGEKDDEGILVVRYQGKLRALSNYCPHFGAPLHTGIIIDNIVKCPWHGASFDIVSGETDISPSINNLPVYEVFESESGFYVNLPAEIKDVKKSIHPHLSKRDPNDKRRFVIIGGGPAGLSAAETLRQNGYTGEITILSSEGHLPYDRTILSKFIPPTIERITLRSSEFLKEYGMDIQTNISVTGIDNKHHKIKLSTGEEISYDKLLIATGGTPVVPKIPGSDSENVFFLRTYDDIQKIGTACKSAKDIVIVGGGFIGMESASTLKKMFPNSNVTVVEKYQTPFFNTLGKEIGKALQNLHEEKGVHFTLGRSVQQIQKEQIILDDGSSIKSDVILFGLGITPNSQFISNDSIAMDRSFVKTDSYLNTSDENIFAAGDIATVPYFKTGEYINFGHYVNAQQQGSIAALNMLGKKTPYEYVPFFWSRHWDKSIQYTGYGSTWDEVFIDGDLSGLKFVAYYIKDNKVVGFAAMNTPNAANIMYEAFRNDKTPRATFIKSGNANLETIKNSLKQVKVKCARADCACARRRAEAEAAAKKH